MSKTFYAVSGSVLVVAITLAAYLFLKRSGDVALDALRAVPVDAALIFETNDFEDFLHKVNQENKIWKELMHFEEIEQIDRQMLFLDSIIQNEQTAKELIHRNSLYVSAHQTGKNNLGLVWIVTIPQGVHDKQVQDLIGDLAGNGTITQKEYNKIKIFWQTKV